MNRLTAVYTAEISACPKRQAVFLLPVFRRMESRMKRMIFKIHGHQSLAPSGETVLDLNRKKETE